MSVLRGNDIDRLVACTAELYRWNDSPSFEQHVVAVIARLIGDALPSYQSFNFAAGTNQMAFSRRPAAVDRTLGTFLHFIHQHPLVNHMLETADARALRVSDVASAGEFRRTDLYNEFYRKVGVEHQLAVRVPMQPWDIAAVILSRGGRDFSDRERELLDRIAPHVLEAGRQFRRFAAISARLRKNESILNALNLGLIELDAALRVQQCNLQGVRILRRHFPAHVGSGLPPELRDWLGVAAARYPDGGCRYRLATAAGVLKLHLICAPPRWLLAMQERSRAEGIADAAASEPLQQLGLTPREAEILLWISQGKSNPEIATILGSHRRTVAKHVEHILKKMQVETRGAAAAIAMEMLL